MSGVEFSKLNESKCTILLNGNSEALLMHLHNLGSGWKALICVLFAKSDQIQRGEEILDSDWFT